MSGGEQAVNAAVGAAGGAAGVASTIGSTATSAATYHIPGATLILKGLKTFTLAHPLGLLGIIAGGLLALGLYDAVRASRDKR